jgi:anhydro-N-acetylmuramic acid kinase
LPKTTGREEFGEMFVKKFLTRAKQLRLTKADTMATATMFTAASIWRAYRRFVFPKVKREDLKHVQTILGGGGAKNVTLVRMLKQQMAGAFNLRTHEDFDIPSSAKEPLAFAILAHATINGLPSNVPAVTGARRAVVLGKIVPVSLSQTLTLP